MGGSEKTSVDINSFKEKVDENNIALLANTEKVNKNFFKNTNKKLLYILVFGGLMFISIVSFFLLKNWDKIQNHENDKGYEQNTDLPVNVYEGWVKEKAENMRIEFMIPPSWSVEKGLQDVYFYDEEKKPVVSLNSYGLGFDEFCSTMDNEIKQRELGSLESIPIKINGFDTEIITCNKEGKLLNAYMEFNNQDINEGVGLYFVVFDISEEKFKIFINVLESISFTIDKNIVKSPEVLSPSYSVSFKSNGIIFTDKFFSDEVAHDTIPHLSDKDYESFNMMVPATVTDENGKSYTDLDQGQLCAEFIFENEAGNSSSLCFKDGYFSGSGIVSTTSETVNIKNGKLKLYSDYRELVLDTPINKDFKLTKQPRLLCTKCVAGVVFDSDGYLKSGIIVRLYVNKFSTVWNPTDYSVRTEFISQTEVAKVTTDIMGRFMFSNLDINKWNSKYPSMPDDGYTVIVEGADMDHTASFKTSKQPLHFIPDNKTYYFTIDSDKDYQQMGFYLKKQY